MGADAFGEAAGKALTPAVGIETFHNFTLLHDDVMDRSDVRRGRPTVHKKYGENAAILSGDTMLTLATDMDFETSDKTSLPEYMQMIEGKTGSLLGASAKIGAIIGGAGEKDADLMYDFGMAIGVAFQIQDDWLDTFGDPTTFGKPIGGDILNSKKTYLYLSGISEHPDYADALRAAMNMAPGESKIKTVTRLYEKLGIKESAAKAVAHYSSKAMTSLKKTSLGDEEKEAFKKLAEKLIGRKK